MKLSTIYQNQLDRVSIANYLESRENEKTNGSSAIDSKNQQWESWIKRTVTTLKKLEI